MGPIIDPDKTNAWLAAMRGSFAQTLLGTVVLLAIASAFLALLFLVAWQAAHQPKHHI
jgi:ABC-type uncharacterized transport system YnjBCD permease subunit